jgi:hypothetical protein
VGGGERSSVTWWPGGARPAVGVLHRGGWYTKGGKFAFAGVQKSGLNAARLQHFCPSAPPSETLGQCLSQHGYTQWTSYQPASRFWPFQWIEGGWLLALLALSVLLIAATVWLVRRRAT